MELAPSAPSFLSISHLPSLTLPTLSVFQSEPSDATADMSIFSKIRGAKKAADKHKKAKSTEIPVEQKDIPVPYRHIPTHAAIDALTGAPASWREEDRAAIKYQHKRRSMITRNNSGMSSGGTLYHSGSYVGSDFSSYGMTAAPSTRPSSAKLDTRRSYQGPGHYQPSPLGSTRKILRDFSPQ